MRVQEALRTVMLQRTSSTGALSGNSAEVLYGLLLGETTTFPVGSWAAGFTGGISIRTCEYECCAAAASVRWFAVQLVHHTTCSSVGDQPLADI